MNPIIQFLVFLLIPYVLFGGPYLVYALVSNRNGPLRRYKAAAVGSYLTVLVVASCLLRESIFVAVGIAAIGLLLNVCVWRVEHKRIKKQAE